MEERQWKIGKLAEATGLTVRTLHHYDELGLLRPADRTYAGHRLYESGQLERLYRIRALRGLGLSLEEVASLLDGEGADLTGLVRRQLERLEHELEEAAQLRRRLSRVLDELDRTGEPSPETLIDAMEAMTMYEKHYSSDQLAQIEERRVALGEEGMEQAQRDWAELIAAVEAERERGTDPADQRMQELAGRWRAMIDAFTGGDAGTERSLDNLYREEGAERASHGMMDASLMAYVGKAMAVRERS